MGSEPNSKTGLTRSEELEIVIKAISTYAIKHDLDPAEISDLFAEACDDFTLPEFTCPLESIVTAHTMIRQGNEIKRPVVKDHAKQISKLIEEREEIKQTLGWLPSSEVGKRDELLDRINGIGKEMDKLIRDA